MINYKEKVIEMGFYVFNPLKFMHLLNNTENSVFNVILNFEDRNQKYISQSLFEIMTLTRKGTIKESIKNLEKIEFISLKATTTKGTNYIINWKIIYDILNQLVNEENIYKSLVIANNYRISKGLKSICESQLKKFEHSEFNIDLEKNESVKIPIIKKQNSNEEFEIKITNKLNLLLDQRKNETESIKINNINNEINLIKKNLNARKIKMELDRTNNIYKIIK